MHLLWYMSPETGFSNLMTVYTGVLTVVIHPASGCAVVTIPKAAILSIRSRSCLLSEFLPSPVIYGAEAQLGLALCLYGEMCVG